MARFKRLGDDLNANFRNDYNENIGLIENDVDQSLLDSSYAKQQAESVKEEFDKVVAEAGSNNPEVVQARGEFENLNQRLEGNYNSLNAQLADIAIINVKQFGAVGDGVTDDTIAIQNAFNASEGKQVDIPSNYNCLVSQPITLPNNVIINCKGEFKCTGDFDYWFSANNPNRIVFERIKATVTIPFSSRTKYNRVIRCDNPKYFEVKVAEIIGASTAIHSLNGEDFICGDITLKNVYGKEAQYGYGINTSAKRTTIKTLNVINDDTTHGRHAIYINGSQWENVDIGYIYVKNFNKNPINIANTDINAKASLHVGTAVFINANIEPTVDSTGCIHGADENGANIRITIDNMHVNGIGGVAVGSQGVNDGFRIGNLYAENLPPAAFTNTSLVYLRYGSNKQVGKVVCTGLNTNWLTAVYIRDSTNAIVDDVTVNGSLGSQAVRLVNSTVTVGSVQSDIEKVLNSGSTLKYKQLQQTFNYGGAAPTTGTWKKRDIIWNLNPTASGYLGWICVADGTPGTWKGFGLIEA
ncbi:hypothetical protein F0342_06985 [Bacillus sp. CH30_1T]|uniref:hypothetical protein n=1 Tax=Bacillus sp. CH30_1T TaxID=2604836 RepID=UPI0011EE9FA6|nr:hypothetical protein [Bacillus sp. CH30_1T]KAA0565347.1 hypothetical protein F0342_06985 [Bacillus sp. CH30_1T]